MSNNLNNRIKIFEEKIKEAGNIAIVPHYNPDGDAIGSALALYKVLSNYGKNVKVISPSQFPEFLKWMPDANNIKVLGEKTKSDPEIFNDTDLLIGVDFNALSRINNVAERFKQSKAYKILIDHHPHPESFTDLSFSDTLYSSTAEFVFDIAYNSFLKEYISKDAATCFYVGIMTDTGSFNYNSSNPNTYLVVSKLLEYGIDKDNIYDKVYNSFSENRMHFMGHVLLNRMVVIAELKTAYIYITAKDRKLFHEQFGDTENFVNLPLSIKGIIFSAIFIERDNFIKISFRSKGTFATNELSSKYFNGGGHINASGGESFDTLQETIKKFVDVLYKYENELKNCSY